MPDAHGTRHVDIVDRPDFLALDVPDIVVYRCISSPPPTEQPAILESGSGIAIVSHRADGIPLCHGLLHAPSLPGLPLNSVILL
jgi:hypothetical protein